MQALFLYSFLCFYPINKCDKKYTFVAIVKNNVPLYLLILLVAAAVLAGGWFLYRTLAAGQASGPIPVDQNAVDWTESLPEGQNSEELSEGIRIPGFKTMTVKAGVKEQQVRNLVNPAENRCYFVLKLVLLDDAGQPEETLYESDAIPPGKGITAPVFKRALDPGIYKAQLQYEAYDLQTFAELNGAVVNFDLIAA